MMGFLRVSLVGLLCALWISAQEPRFFQKLPAGVLYPAATANGFSLPGSQVPSQAPASRPRAISYSDGYLLRQKIHKYASFATLPLFVGQFAVGQKLYSGDASESLRSAHSGLAAGTAVLFGVNSVTGVWNLWEGRKNPAGRGRRLLHGILMLSADVGFLATAALAPDEEGEGRRSGRSLDRRSTHRTVALTSMGIAGVSYLYMLITR